MTSRRLTTALGAIAAIFALTSFAATAIASAPPKPVSSNAVPVSGAAVTKVTARAAVNNDRLTVTLVPGHYPFAKVSTSLKGRVSDWSASAIKIKIQATGARKGTGTVTVTGPLNSVEPDIAVFTVNWTVATTNTGTIKLTPQEA